MIPIGTVVSFKYTHMIGIVCAHDKNYPDYNIVRFRDQEEGYTIELYYRDQSLKVIS